MVTTAYKTDLISVGLPADTYMRALESFCLFRSDGDSGTSMEQIIGSQNILDNSRLHELDRTIYNSFCSSIQKLTKSAKYYRIERFLSLILRRN